MLCTAQVQKLKNPEVIKEEHLLYVRHYCSVHDELLSAEQREEDLTLRHLIWEQGARKGKSKQFIPSYAVVNLESVRRRVCISPHFSHWERGQRGHFLLNDLIELFPPEELLPRQCCLRPTVAPGHAAITSALCDTDSDGDNDDADSD